MLKFLSVNNIVIAPANTGKDNNNKKAVLEHSIQIMAYDEVSSQVHALLNIVVIKFIAPNKEDAPERCKLNIAKSTDAPECRLNRA